MLESSSIVHGVLSEGFWLGFVCSLIITADQLINKDPLFIVASCLELLYHEYRNTTY